VPRLALFVAVGDYSSCATSTNGVDWSSRTIPTGSYAAAAEGSGRLCAVGFAGACAVSTDAITWTDVTLPSSVSSLNLRTLTFTGAIFCSILDNPSSQPGTVMTSQDGEVWSVQAQNLPYAAFYRSLWSGAMVVAAGPYGIATSLTV
jgi:hypothetical protein